MRYRDVSAIVLLFAGLHPAGSRAADETIRGFVSVEPFELRLEALVRVEPYRQAWRMEGDSIGPEEKQVLLDNFLTLFESGVKVKSPGNPILFSERSMRFVVLDTERGYTPDTRESIPLSEAIVGLTLSSTARGISELELEWTWFGPGQERMVLEIASRGKPSARFLTPEANAVRWSLEQPPALPYLQDVPALERVEHRPFRYLLFAGAAMIVYGGFVVIRQKTASPSWVGWLLAVGILTGFFAVKIRATEIVVPGEAETEDLVYALLRNTYHAFDFRDESSIYDTLGKSITGPLLERVYLEMRASLELESSGGPRVRVYEIALRECRNLNKSGEEPGTFRAFAEWVTVGEVTHWGHTHERTNKYEAEVAISAAGEEWKISGLDLLNEERVQKVSRRAAEPES